MKTLFRQRPTLVLIAALVVVTPIIASNPVWLDTSVTIAIYGLLALSVGIAWGQAGILSIAQAAFAAVGAYAAAISSINYGWPPVVGLVAALVVPMVIAYPLAIVVTRLPALALAIATLASGEILYALMREGGSFTGGYIGLSGVPQLSFATTPIAYHILAWSCVTIVVALYANLVRSRHGTALRTISHDRIRAVSDGVNVSRALAGVFSFAAGVAGLAGWLYAYYISYVSPESLSTNLSISVLLMAVVGGVGTVLGPLVGAAALTLVYQFIPADASEGIFYGAAVILALIAAPTGLLGLVQTRRRGVRSNNVGPAHKDVETVAGAVNERDDQ